MTTRPVTAGVLRHAAAVAWADYRSLYTPWTWAVSVLLRFLVQVSFWSLFGELVGGRPTIHHLLVGHSALLAASATMFAIPSTTWEQRDGTIPLLVVTPTPIVLPMLGRSLEWMVDAVLTSSLTLLAVGHLFDLPLPWDRFLLAVVVMGLTALCSYGLALTLGTVALGAVSSRNVLMNVTNHTMMALCGVTIPLAAYEGWLHPVARVLPLTSGLAAVRTLLAGGGPAAAAGDLALLATTGAAWLAVAIGALTLFVHRGRRTGRLGAG